MSTYVSAYNMLTGGGVAPQSLSQPSPPESPTVNVQHMANGLRNVYEDRSLHLDVLYSQYETPFRSNMVCPSGSVGVNNECLCPGAPSGVPYRQAIPTLQNQISALFSPIQPQMFPQVGAAAAMLVRERGPCPQGYQPMDSSPLTECAPMSCSR